MTRLTRNVLWFVIGLAIGTFFALGPVNAAVAAPYTSVALWFDEDGDAIAAVDLKDYETLPECKAAIEGFVEHVKENNLAKALITQVEGATTMGFGCRKNGVDL